MRFRVGNLIAALKCYRFRIGDLIAAVYLLTIVYLLVHFNQEFVWLTMHYPYLMGFLKVSCIATFGESFKMRIKAGSWHLSRPVFRFVVWGFFGVWFAAAFPLISFGVEALIAKGLWPRVDGYLLALSKSFWINIGGGYAFSMMITHEYFNRAIAEGRPISLTVFAECMAGRDASLFWFRITPILISTFWLIMHSITFSLPGVYYVLMAAGLSFFLGLFLTFLQQSKSPKTA
ncbi:MAG: hypothetical protein WCV50_04350 [Patescibacteria group bacterium]|jgi:hypothetical protein